ncbi:uncharacterized protein TRIADDRAFT_62480 [Trichoplax adhaerens]|uniref:Protein kinase domain-containing protein n=1 Tax=Trichoplax adhaerens TaxID=10228 RepID=B3SDX6_TRIAD|nr:hypothetical protein TRIADDRAFT_62480 [Trichoplax adhaerens]EDV19066.1 hypothetical protein TRIADDRAFT_62480 [Trichoplax adhaerens]|eukprot:XP_002118445.1 hypothetical protein TRIADDRAFT_62480 [Trichoplax adhaerens]
MCYVSANRFIHRDLALRNIAIIGNQTAKISNFNFATEENSYAPPLHHYCIKWMAPESIKEELYTSKSDIWGFGILLWELFSSGSEPYAEISGDSILGVIEGGLRLDCPENCSPNVYHIMKDCWNALPKDRPTFVRIKELLLNLKAKIMQGQHNDIPEFQPVVNDNEVTI